MTATVTRLAPPGRPFDIASHLSGTSRRQMGMMERMMGQDAMRLFVRAIASKHPLSDARGNGDVWAQVEDVCAHMPTITSGTGELETYVHAIRGVLSGSHGGRLAISEGNIGAGRIRISAYRSRLRIALDATEGRRLVDFRLEDDGAIRINDHLAGE